MCKWGNTKQLNINGIVRDIDSCIYDLVTVLNKSEKLTTVACCCGHGNIPGNIVLADGRELLIVKDYKTARDLEKKIGIDIHNEKLGEKNG